MILFDTGKICSMGITFNYGTAVSSIRVLCDFALLTGLASSGILKFIQPLIISF